MERMVSSTEMENSDMFTMRKACDIFKGALFPILR